MKLKKLTKLCNGRGHIVLAPIAYDLQTEASPQWEVIETQSAESTMRSAAAQDYV